MKKIIDVIINISMISFCLFFGLCGIVGITDSDMRTGGVVCIVLTALVAFTYFIRKRNNKIKEQKDYNENIKDNELLNKGYKKIYNEFYVNEKEKNIYLNQSYFGFSNILESEIIKNSNTLTSSYGTSSGKLKHGKVKSRINTFSSEIQYCKDLYVNVVVNNLSKPNEKIYLKSPNSIFNLNENSAKYNKLYKEAQRIQSTLQIIIKNGKENYIENGTVTKIEHRYITEEDAMSKIQKLSELHEAGVLTDYEFSVKKQELLDKVK